MKTVQIPCIIESVPQYSASGGRGPAVGCVRNFIPSGSGHAAAAADCTPSINGAPYRPNLLIIITRAFCPRAGRVWSTPTERAPTLPAFDEVSTLPSGPRASPLQAHVPPGIHGTRRQRVVGRQPPLVPLGPLCASGRLRPRPPARADRRTGHGSGIVVVPLRGGRLPGTR